MHGRHPLTDFVKCDYCGHNVASNATRLRESGKRRCFECEQKGSTYGMNESDDPRTPEGDEDE